MSSKKTPHVIVGALLHPNTGQDMDHWRRCAISFITCAAPRMFSPKKSSPDILVFIQEDESKKVWEPVVIQGQMHLAKRPLSALEIMITAAEQPPPKRKKLPSLKIPDSSIFLGIGDLDYCLAAVHYMATGKGDAAQNWGMHLMRRLVAENVGTVVGYDTKKPKNFFCDSIGELYKATQDAFQNMAAHKA